MKKMILSYQLGVELQFITQIQKLNKKLTKNYSQTKSTKKEKKEKKSTKSIQLPRNPGFAEAVHSALDVSIYRLSNVGPYFKTMLWIPKFLAQFGCSFAIEF